ncbi:MAG: SgrR family transcriptional regulator, partial [Gammaproteobacteria bacterium]|nr:SgrR family transcriptional regulator [Gammaproteobacteria bacterium]
MKSSTPSNSLIAHFQRLSKYYAEEKDIQTSIEQLAQVLCCTRRNVNNVLNKMSQQGWLSWQPARGRGKLSRLILHTEAKQPILQMAKNKADQGLLEEAFALLDEAGDRTSLFNYLKTQLGFQNEVYGNQSLRIPYHRPLPILDPGQATRIAETHMVNQVMDTLVIFDRGSQQIRPSLAHSWRSNKDGTHWQFFLRPGIKFHHGRQLLAEDVAATLQHLKTTASPFQSLYLHIQDIQCPEPLSLNIQLNRRDYLLLHLLANHSSVIKPMELINDKDFTRKPVGTGPFMITQNNDFQLEL